MPAHVCVIVGGRVHLIGRQCAAQPGLGQLRKDQSRASIDQRVGVRPAPAGALHLAHDLQRGLVPGRRSHRLHLLPDQPCHRVVGQARARFADPVLLDPAAGQGCRRPGDPVQRRADRLGLCQVRHPDHVLQVRLHRRQVVRRGLAGAQNGLGDRPAAAMGQHGVPALPRHLVHGDQRIIGPRRADIRMRLRNGGAILRAPAFRRVTAEPVDHRIRRPTLRVPAHRVAQGQHVEGMEGQYRRQPVIIAPGRVDGFGPAHFLGGLAGKAQAALDSVPLHRRLGRQKPAQPGHAQTRMRIGMPGRQPVQPVARARLGGGGLTIAGHRVIFGIHAHHRPVATGPLRAKGCGHSARAFLDRKALGPQPLHIPRGRAVFAPGAFAMVENRRTALREVRGMGLDPGRGGRKGAHAVSPLRCATTCRLCGASRCSNT